MSPKPPPVFTRPAMTAEATAKLAEIENWAEARGNGVPSEPASSQARSAAKPQARDTAASAARSGTKAAPYVRARDGQATRSTTVHLPVDLHTALRRTAAERDVHMSAIIAEAVRAWLAANSAR